MKQTKRFFAVLLAVIMLTSAFVFTSSAATLVWPVPGHTSLSQGFHDGKAIDISDGNIAGATVVAAMSGTVTHIFLCGEQHYGSMHDCNGFGTGLVILGDDGRYYQYCHMQADSIPTDAYRTCRVSAGQMIGRVGTTGNSSGYHLHFGISTGNYWNESGINPQNETYTYMEPGNDLGSDFYANIIKNDGWAPLGVVGKNVQIVPSLGDVSEYWHFVRDTDGSYIISNCSNGQVMDVWGAETENGANVCVHENNGGKNQRWQITGPWSGEYYLSPLHTNKVLDVNNNDSAVGTNVQLWEKNNSKAQQFAIYKQEKAGASVLRVSVENDSVTFSWTKGANCDHYRIRIDNKVTGETIDFWDLKTLSKTAVLPAGSYTAYVDSCNAFSFIKSNDVSFVVSKHTHSYTSTIVTAATCVKKGSQKFTCSCGDSYTESIPVNPSNHVNTKNIAATASTCTVNGYTAGVYCNDCKKYISGHQQQPLAAHTITIINQRDATQDAEGYTGDEYCTVCKQTIKQGTVIQKLDKPADPTPDTPSNPQPENGCKWCGKTHTGFFGGIVGFFHRIFAAIFGARH